jgi:isoamylase
MEIDGFRFDLATILGREPNGFDPRGGFFDAVGQDPTLSRVKLIGEPWDIGPGGYQVGGFPPGWSEWNGKYRDTVRRFWRGDGGVLPELASRLAGSSDLFEHHGRRPRAGVNFVTVHDGFTLNDLVSYNQKHNEANGEGNVDGESYNRSWNCGAEGETSDPTVRGLRARLQRNFLTTLFLAQGVPMLVAGDEMGRTQRGNNNPYCQDNEVSWVKWSEIDDQLLTFARWIIAFRREHPVFRRQHFFQGQPIRGSVDIGWFKSNGQAMTDQDWEAGHARSLGVFLNGKAILGDDERGEPISDDSFVLLFNTHTKGVVWTIPDHFEKTWFLVLNTAKSQPEAGPIAVTGGVSTAAHTLVVLQAS